MKIPIFNSLYGCSFAKSYSSKLNIKKLNNLNLKFVNISQFPVLKIIKYFSFKNDSLLETFLLAQMMN